MMKKIVSVTAALSLFAFNARADLTINGLGAGAAVSGTDIFPAYQGANPATGVTGAQIKTYVGSAVTLVSTLTANNTATSIAWTGLTGNEYIIRCQNLTASNTSDQIDLQFGEGGTPTWETSGYNLSAYYTSLGTVGVAPAGGANQSGMIMLTTETAKGVSGTINFHSLATNASHTWDGEIETGSYYLLHGSGTYATDTTPITAIRFIENNSHNLSSGSCSLYSVSS